METAESVSNFTATTSTPSPRWPVSTTSFPETDDFLVVTMATVAGIVVFIILVIVVCFVVKTKRRARANVRRMHDYRRRHTSQIESLQTQSRPVSQLGSYQSRSVSQMGSISLSASPQPVLREVHQPLYGPASFTTEVIWSNLPEKPPESPDYENSPDPVLIMPQTVEPDQNEDRPSSEYVDTSGYKEDLSAIQKRALKKCDESKEDLEAKSEISEQLIEEFPNACVIEKDVKEEKRKCKSKHTKRIKHNGKTETKSSENSCEDMAGICEENGLDLPPPTPCALGPKYVNVDPDDVENVFEKTGVDPISFGYVNTCDALDHCYMNITKAMTFGKRGYSTSVLPSKKDEYENAYMPMDMKGSLGAVAEEMYIAMERENESRTLPLYVNTCKNDEDVYISPSGDQLTALDWDRNKRYVNYPRPRSIDEVYSIAKSEDNLKIKY